MSSCDVLCCAVLCCVADEGIPDFWLTAMANHDMIGEYVTERDAEVLSHLRDVRHISLTGDDAGSFKVEFHFNKNPFFTNEVRPPLLLLLLLLLLRVVVFVSYAYVSATAM
jgi:hypothetical protein